MNHHNSSQEEPTCMTVHSSTERKKSMIESMSENHTLFLLQHLQTKHLSYLLKRSDQDEDYIELDFEQPDVYQSDVLLRMGTEDYFLDRACLSGNQFLQFYKFKVSIIGIQKVKIYRTHIRDKTFHLKVSHQQIVFDLALDLKCKLHYLPQHYLWFAKLVNARMMRIGGRIQLKGCKNKTVLHQNGLFNQGFIFKCSKYRKKWQRRFIVINTEGLYSYKNQNDNYTLFIPTSSVSEIWTNFQIFQQNLIIKVRHGVEKTEFGIPMLDYCVKEDSDNWLFAFYRLMMQSRIHIKV